jgi:spore coat protein H
MLFNYLAANHRQRIVIRFARILPCVCFAFASACIGAEAAAPKSTGELFDPTRAHTIEIRLSSEGWDLLQPGAGAQKAAAVTNLAQAKAAGVRLRAGAPASYAYVLSEMEFDGQRFADVGVRFKGNSSYAVSAGTLRRPMKLDFERFAEGKQFAGVESFNLSNTSFDPSQVREALGFWMFHALEVPASRTGHALVYLTVAGKYNREYLGLYTLIEEVDSVFLKKHFGNVDGLLLKPSGMRGFAYLGEKWDDYKGICNPRTGEPPALCQKVIDFARLIHRADNATFRAKIGSMLAVDEFLRYVAVISAMVNFDSFLSTGHNYYIYVNPADGLIHFIPWDLNMSFGGYGWVGTDEEITRTSITRSYADHNILVERLLAIDEYANAYRAHMRKLADLCLSARAIKPRRELLRPVLASAEKAEQATGRTNNAVTKSVTGMGLNAPDLWWFVDRRAESIRLQLENKETGFKPEFRNPKRTLIEWAPLIIAANTFMDAADSDGDRRLTDSEVTAAIKRLLAAANLPADGSMDRATAVATIEKVMPEDLRRRIPAKAWSDWLFSIADANKDERVTAAEMFAAYHRLQSSSDADRDGRMDGRDMIEALIGAGCPRDPEPAR